MGTHGARGEGSTGPSLFVVVVGRNLGPRLSATLRSLGPWRPHTLYVDSASSDGSEALARAQGFSTLSLALPVVGAAQGRNAGWEEGRRRWGTPHAVQFLDGDCRLEAGWLEAGGAYLEAHPEVDAVCGHQREEIQGGFHWLRDQEWRGPVGPVLSATGNFLLRGRCLERAQFDGTLESGEEEEIFLRTGWVLHRIDVPMCRHHECGEGLRRWWDRGFRTGKADGDAWRRGGVRRRAGARRSLRVLANAVGACAALVLGVKVGWSWVVGGGLLHLWNCGRRYGNERQLKLNPGQQILLGFHFVALKLPEAWGLWRGWARR